MHGVISLIADSMTPRLSGFNLGLLASGRLELSRLALALVFLFSNFLGRGYETTLWPALGFLFAPLTTLAYAAAINWNGQVTGAYFVMVLVAALMDLGSAGGGGRAAHRHRHRS